MNLLHSDVLSARKALDPWAIPSVKITSGWHNGSISVIVKSEVDPVTQEMLRSILEATTSINIPIVFVTPEPEPEEFRFNFETAP